MQSMSDLNSFGKTQVDVVDDRDGFMTFDREQADDQTSTIYENITHTVPMGINILEIINYGEVTPVLVIDMSSLTGTNINLTIGTQPSYVTVTETSSKVFEIAGFRDHQDWADVTESIDVEFDIGFFGSFTYDVSLQYEGSQSKDYEVDLTIFEIPYFSTPTDSFIGSNVTLYAISGTPDILDVDVSPLTEWTLTITPQQTGITNMASAISNGATVVFSNDVLTITGEQDDVNDHLDNLQATTDDIFSNIDLRYELSNDVSSVVDVAEQTLVGYTTQTGSTVNYLSNQKNDLLDTIIQVATTLTGDNTLIVSVDQGEVLMPSITPASSINKSGTAAEINTAIAGLEYYSTIDQTGNVTLSFELRSGVGVSGTILSQGSLTLNYTGVGSVADAIYHYTYNTSHIPTYEQVLYKSHDLVLIAGGGAGGTGNNGRYFGPAGGGGGARWIQNFNMLNSSYSLTIGAGGTFSTVYSFPASSYPGEAGSDGGNTTGFGYTVVGGEGGDPVSGSGKSGYPSGSTLVNGVRYPNTSSNSTRISQGDWTDNPNFGGGGGIYTRGDDAIVRTYEVSPGVFIFWNNNNEDGDGGGGVTIHPNVSSLACSGGGGVGGISYGNAGVPSPYNTFDVIGEGQSGGGTGANGTNTSNIIDATDGVRGAGGGGGFTSIGGGNIVDAIGVPGDGGAGSIYVIVKD
jgi:hypothetical protein